MLPLLNAAKHLCEKEKGKLKRKGMAKDNSIYFSGKDLIGSLLASNKVLIPLAITSPYGRWGSMFHAFLIGPEAVKHLLSFCDNITNCTHVPLYIDRAHTTPLDIFPTPPPPGTPPTPTPQHSMAIPILCPRSPETRPHHF
jgi:hypothetical protein